MEHFFSIILNTFIYKYIMLFIFGLFVCLIIYLFAFLPFIIFLSIHLSIWYCFLVHRLKGYSTPKWKFCHYSLTHKKYSLSLHKIQIDPLTADGLPWRCFSFFSEPRQWYLLDSRWDNHNPSFYLKYLKLCSEDELSFYGVETTCG